MPVSLSSLSTRSSRRSPSTGNAISQLNVLNPVFSITSGCTPRDPVNSDSSMLSGRTSMSGGIRPTPVIGSTRSGVSGSLLDKVSEPVMVPSRLGVNVIRNECRSAGASSKTRSVTTKSSGSARIELTLRTSVPAFEISSSSRVVPPTNSDPKSSTVSDARMSAAPVTCRTTGMRTSPSWGSLLRTRIVKGCSPPISPLALSSTSSSARPPAGTTPACGSTTTRLGGSMFDRTISSHHASAPSPKL